MKVERGREKKKVGKEELGLAENERKGDIDLSQRCREREKESWIFKCHSFFH